MARDNTRRLSSEISLEQSRVEGLKHRIDDKNEHTADVFLLARRRFESSPQDTLFGTLTLTLIPVWRLKTFRRWAEGTKLSKDLAVKLADNHFINNVR